MAVLIEALSVVVRVDALMRAYPGGAAQYEVDCPNRTFCSDGYLTRVGFMDPRDVKAHVDGLTCHGLRFVDRREALEIVVVDQFQGPTASCSWLVVGRDPKGFAFAFLVGTAEVDVAFPSGWSLAQSKSIYFVPEEEKRDRFFPLAEKDGVQTHLDLQTGHEAYLGRIREDRPGGDR